MALGCEKKKLNVNLFCRRLPTVRNKPWLVIFIVVVLFLFTFGTIVNLFYYLPSILSLCQRVISYVSQ